MHEQTLANVHRQQLVEVNGQTDVLVLGLPYLGPYNVNSVMNPILATCLGLGYFFNMYRGQPLVRQGGAVILYHPVPWEFNQLHHPSYVDFFEEVLAESTDPATIEAKFEQQYATDPWYIHLYRTSHAYHGVHPFYMWYWGAHALDHVERRRSGSAATGGPCARMGFRAASTLARRAGDGRRGTVGTSPSITYLHNAAARASRTCGERALRRSVCATVARGWRWGARPLAARLGRRRRPPYRRPRGVPDRLGAHAGRRAVPRALRPGGGLEPLVWSQVAPQVSGLDVLDGVSTGRCIFVANHSSHLDTPLILCSLPAGVAVADGGRPRRPTTSSTAGGGRSAPPRSCSTPSRSTAGRRVGRRPRATCSASGWNLVVFPEGTRSPDGRWAGSGSAPPSWPTAIDVPIVPIGIRGAFAAMPRGRSWPAPGRRTVAVRFGRPMRPGAARTFEH